jgi:putative oligomerization/nucleic acid binding protein
MGYYVRSTLGLAIFFASLAAFGYCLYHLIKTGTCGSSQQYVSVRPCPSGTGTLIVVLTLSIFTGIGGAVLYALRGEAPGPDGRGKEGLPLAALAMPLLFTTIGVVGLYTSFGPGQNTDETFGIAFGGIFFLVGVVPLVGILLFGASRFRRGGRSSGSGGGPTQPVRAPATMPPPGVSPEGVPLPSPTIRPTQPPIPGAPQPGAQQPFGARPPTSDKADDEDPIDRLKKLAELRDKGVLSEAEFQAAKAKLLGDVE